MQTHAVETAPPRTFSERLLRPLRRTTAGGGLIPEVDGLRCLAVLAVIAYHWPVVAPVLAQTSYAAVVRHANYGVQLFFAISGFILALPFARAALADGRRPTLRHYLLRRVTRLEPPFVVSLLIFFAIQIARDHGALRANLPHFIATLGYAHNLVFSEMSRINNVAWSLEIEVQFYLLMPLLAYVYRLRGTASRIAVMAVLAAASVAATCTVGSDAWRFHFSILGQMPYFLVGLGIADCYARGGVVNTRGGDGLVLAALLAFPLVVRYSPADAALMPLLILALFWGTLGGRVARAAFGNVWPATVGGMCYTIYLYHFALLRNFDAVARRVLGGSTVGLTGRVLAVTAVTLLVCVPLFLLLEKPFMRRDWTAAVGRVVRKWRPLRAAEAAG